VKVTFLGTGTSQGVPVIACHCEVCQSTDSRDKRLRSSILIEAGGKTIVIDTGPDFRQQMLRENVACVDAVLFTHEHKDHTAGLDDVRAFNFARQLPMDVYSEERVQKSLMSEFPYVFAEKKYPGVPQILLHTISELPFEVEGIKVVPIRTMHHELPILGFRFGEFTYITDTNFISNAEKEKVRGSKYIVVTGLRKKKHLSHFSLSEALQFIDEMKPQRGYITHCSHELGLYSAIQNELPENVTLAFDGLKIEF
jgi:phosphoribosyl 1,2-cyclic phosphate phosphodiesterase